MSMKKLIYTIWGVALFLLSSCGDYYADMGDKFERIEVEYQNLKFKSNDQLTMSANPPAEGVLFTITPKGKYRDEAKKISVDVFGIYDGESGDVFDSQKATVKLGAHYDWDKPVLSGEWGNIKYRMLDNPDTPFAIDIMINENSSGNPLGIYIRLGELFTASRELHLIQTAVGL